MIKSMTAFATETEEGKWGSLTWEIRSLNQRYLDLTFRLPEHLRHLEPELRKLAAEQLKRGKVECSLKYKTEDSSEQKISLNILEVKKLAKATKELEKYFSSSLQTMTPLEILSWGKVISTPTSLPNAVGTKTKTLYKKALAKLIDARKKEGKTLKKVIKEKLQLAAKEQKKIQALYPETIKNHRTQLLQQLEAVAEKLDQQRLEQEMVYFAQKTDIAEEIDRLQAHLIEVAKILDKGGMAGKRLDFFMQELNRETNTIASKAADKKITHSAVELKVLIEQIREQVQNIE